jgi:hypothetical protein
MVHNQGTYSHLTMINWGIKQSCETPFAISLYAPQLSREGVRNDNNMRGNSAHYSRKNTDDLIKSSMTVATCTCHLC